MLEVAFGPTTKKLLRIMRSGHLYTLNNPKYGFIPDTPTSLKLTIITHLLFQYGGHNNSTSPSPLSSKGDHEKFNAYLLMITFMMHHTIFQRKEREG